MKECLSNKIDKLLLEGFDSCPGSLDDCNLWTDNEYETCSNCTRNRILATVYMELVEQSTQG